MEEIMGIQSYEYRDAGLKRVYENEHWMIGIKNWKPANDVEGIDCLERHLMSDELFTLLEGECILLYCETSEKEPSASDLRTLKMEKGKVYNIPKGLWHNTITFKNTKLLLVESPDTGMSNSEIIPLSSIHRKRVHAIATEMGKLESMQ